MCKKQKYGIVSCIIVNIKEVLCLEYNLFKKRYWKPDFLIRITKILTSTNASIHSTMVLPDVDSH